MAIKIIINGASGRMGTLATQALGKDQRFTIVAKLEREDDLLTSIKSTHADVVLDLTVATRVYANAQTIITAGCRPVIGTSGLTKQQIAELTQQCLQQRLGGMIVPNFSLGAILLMKLVKEASQHFSEVEIIEMHHEQKVDSPSGTAIRTAELIAQHKTHPNTNNSDHIARGARVDNIPIHSIRLPGILANETVIFGSPGETLTLTHNTLSRDCFAPGILLACEKVMKLDTLVYGLEQIT